MKHICLIFFLVASSSQAKEWETDLFTIDLPDTLIVETDRERRLLAFSELGPSTPPFLSIEFGEGFPIDEVLRSVNESLAALGGELVRQECSPRCKAYYFEGPMETEGETAFVYYNLVKTNRISFIISYLGSSGIEQGRELVKSVAFQIREQNI